MNKINVALLALTAGVGVLSLTSFATFEHISKLEKRVSAAEAQNEAAFRAIGTCVKHSEALPIVAKLGKQAKAIDDLNARLRVFERSYPINARGHKETR